jgi:hypothetical protein
MVEKIFSYGDAVALLPEVKRLTEEAVRAVETLQGSAEELTGASMEVVSRWVDALREKGLSVKGLGLVDFDNGSGFYCWRYPEERLEYFHSYESGFQGRMRIH